LRRLRVLVIASCLAICGAARAQAVARERIDLSVHRDPLRLMIADGLVGGVVGVAVGGALLGIKSAAGHGQRDWASMLATSAGIGIAAGLMWGAMQSRSVPSSAGALRPARDGMSFADQHTHDRRSLVTLPVFGRGF
jgi:hypothetical protein